MSQQQKRHLTAQEVEEEKLRARNEQAQQQGQEQQGQVHQPQQQPQQAQQAPQQQEAASGNGVTKLILKTQYVSIEITDPNILQDLNIQDKYAQNIPFVGLEFNINRHGGRLVVRSSDRKEVLRDILSGVGKKEMMTVENFTVERGPNAPMAPPATEEPQ